jgi:hypothetical protein
VTGSGASLRLNAATDAEGSDELLVVCGRLMARAARMGDASGKERVLIRRQFIVIPQRRRGFA